MRACVRACVRVRVRVRVCECVCVSGERDGKRRASGKEREEGERVLSISHPPTQRDVEMEARASVGEGSIWKGLGGTDGLCQDDSGEGGGTGL